MNQDLLDLAAESVFCSESVETRMAESLTTGLSVFLSALVGAGVGLMWWAVPSKSRGHLPKSLSLLFPAVTALAGWAGAESKRTQNAETFAAAYDMKCYRCDDDERCQSLYGTDYECVEGRCMDVSEEEEDDEQEA